MPSMKLVDFSIIGKKFCREIIPLDPEKVPLSNHLKEILILSSYWDTKALSSR